MAYSTCPHSLLIPSPRRETVTGSIEGRVHLTFAGASGNYTNCRLGPPRSNESTTRKQRGLSIIRAAVDEEENTGQTRSSAAVDTKVEDGTTSGTASSNSLEDKKAAARTETQRGRNTAVITGAISVLLGVGYLVLLQLLDTRGIELIPPPPEAFDP